MKEVNAALLAALEAGADGGGADAAAHRKQERADQTELGAILEAADALTKTRAAESAAALAQEARHAAAESKVRDGVVAAVARRKAESATWRETKKVESVVSKEAARARRKAAQFAARTWAPLPFRYVLL